MLSDRLSLTGKIHVSATEGTVGKSKDSLGRPARTWCGQKSARVNPFFVAPTSEVTCNKCLSK